MENRTVKNTDYKIVYNYEHHGNEIYFAEIPARHILDALKIAGMRWHRVKKCWYGKNTEEEIFAIIGNFPQEGEKPEAVQKAPETFDAAAVADSLTAAPSDKYNLPEHWRKVWKAAGVKGVTVSKGRGGYTSHFTFTVRMLPGDLKTFDECREELENTVLHEIGRVYSWLKDPDDGKEVFKDAFFAWDAEKQQRYIQKKAREDYEEMEKSGISGSVCHYWQLKKESFPMFSGQFWDRWEVIGRSVSCHNYDHSDSMTDYFDVAFYESWYISPVKEGAKEEKRTAATMKAIADFFRAKDDAAREAERNETEKKREEERKEFEELDKKARDVIKEYSEIFPGDLFHPHIIVEWSELLAMHEHGTEENGAGGETVFSVEAWENITNDLEALFRDRPGYEKTKFHYVDGEFDFVDRIDHGDGNGSQGDCCRSALKWISEHPNEDFFQNGGLGNKHPYSAFATRYLEQIPCTASELLDV